MFIRKKNLLTCVLLMLSFSMVNQSWAVSKNDKTSDFDAKKFIFLPESAQLGFIKAHLTFLVAKEKIQNAEGMEYANKDNSILEIFVKSWFIESSNAVEAREDDCVYCMTMRPKEYGKNGYYCPSVDVKASGKSPNSCKKKTELEAGFDGFKVCVPIDPANKKASLQHCSEKAADLYLEKIKNNDPKLLEAIRMNPDAFEAEVEKVKSFCSMKVEPAQAAYEKAGSRPWNIKAGLKLSQKAQEQHFYQVHSNECQAYKGALTEIEAHISRLRGKEIDRAVAQTNRMREFNQLQVDAYEMAADVCHGKNYEECCGNLKLKTEAGPLNVLALGIGPLLEEYKEKNPEIYKKLQEFDKSSYHTIQSITLPSSGNTNLRYLLFQAPARVGETAKNIWCRVDGAVASDGADKMTCSDADPLALEWQGPSIPGLAQTVERKFSSGLKNGRLVIATETNRIEKSFTEQKALSTSEFEFTPVAAYPYGVEVQPRFSTSVIAGDVVRKGKKEISVVAPSLRSYPKPILACADQRMQQNMEQLRRARQ